MASSRRVDDRGSDFYLRAIQFARSVRLRNPWGRRVTRNHSEGSGSNLEAAGIDQAQHESEDSSDEDYQPENSDSESENQIHAEEDEGSTCTEERHDDDIHCGILADHDIFLTTKCNVTSSSVYSKIGSVDRYGTVPTLTMLHGREMNVSRLGRWSKAECCHMAARYLPEDSPHIIDYGKSRVYVGRFSADGSLFVGGFQERHIRIYNVDKRWSIKKDIQAKHLRWTVTDTALSHDQRFLVYATLSPIVHLVNVGSENGVSSVANITVCQTSLDKTE
ncbi:hypothetical protein KP509_23G046900 [Ceratopteris richardii]|uniref:Uncharacterized protein n=1 Tax=Ceratopteris richardii TaxID=49495 RepID=A0A8T2RZC0_CERRI|nr:hypothetical protein KP509_23G046900 [Ceratopteris richardii]KAH7301870.1 hypothetical protein KP509_23G046900 [Ceratopteris richardii]KAH7301871.1 hypothetical protein KP509_23G046900 [Ceratopteris richardii]KAH7301872.1 hypothetical protein KP509_23G046900 [Ceratopteris richardii]